MTLLSASWLSVADVTGRIAYELKLVAKADAGTWTPTTEQSDLIEVALNRSYDWWRQYWDSEGVILAGLVGWDIREDMQFILMMCYLGTTEFLREDPQDSAWPDKFCQQVADYVARNPTAFGLDGVTPLPKTTDSSGFSAKQPRYSRLDGLRGDDNGRPWRSDSASETRSRRMPLPAGGARDTQ